MKTFYQFLENKQQKLLILLRGVSGSGKSTFAKKYQGGFIFSTDDFFMQDGIYKFDPEKIKYYHELNVLRTENAMKQGMTPITIDNTNLKAWEMKPYVELADKYGYKIKIHETDLIDVDELLKRQELRKNIGKNLPRDVLQKMVDGYQRNVSLDDIRNSKFPFEIA